MYCAIPVQTTIDCVLTIEEVEGGQCRQTLEGDITIGIPGLGRIAERIIGSSLRDVYSGIPEIVKRCVHTLNGPPAGCLCAPSHAGTAHLPLVITSALSQVEPLPG
jgi:hypothetical protein